MDGRGIAVGGLLGSAGFTEESVLGWGSCAACRSFTRSLIVLTLASHPVTENSLVADSRHSCPRLPSRVSLTSAES